MPMEGNFWRAKQRKDSTHVGEIACSILKRLSPYVKCVHM
jgi:hypothetical protein